MRYFRLFPSSAVIGFTVLAVAPVNAQYVVSNAGAAVRSSPYELDVQYRRTLNSLRDEGLKQRNLDGGTLTPDHLAGLQRKLDRINDLHRRALRNENPLSVDANGHPIESRNVPRNWPEANLIKVGSPN